VFFVIEGEVRVTIFSLSGKVVSFCELGPGEVFGEYAAIDGNPRSASVEARTSCLVGSMSAIEFLKIFKTEPAVALAVARHLVSIIRVLDKRV
jgi:CRP-like cAMP-binding protein